MDCGTGEHEGWTTSLPQTETSVSPLQGGTNSSLSLGECLWDLSSTCKWSPGHGTYGEWSVQQTWDQLQDAWKSGGEVLCGNGIPCSSPQSHSSAMHTALHSLASWWHCFVSGRFHRRISKTMPRAFRVLCALSAHLIPRGLSSPMEKISKVSASGHPVLGTSWLLSFRLTHSECSQAIDIGPLLRGLGE